MLNRKSYPFCNEFYTVEKSIEVVVTIQGESCSIRIDALFNLDGSKYSTRAYILEDVTAQPTYPQTNNVFSRKPESMRVWIKYDLPWTDRASADDALAQALGFLGERCDK